MDFLNRMQGALTYIEENLDGELDPAQLAQAACCSAYHFPRMFMSLTEVPLSEYIRRRRLTRAASDLQAPGARVLDVAIRYGYESADAFSRAFYRQHRVLPSQVQREGQGLQLTYYPPLAFHLTIQGGTPMQVRFEHLDFPLRIVGRPFPVDTATVFEEAPEIWRREMESGFVPRLIDMAWERPQCRLESLLAVCGDKPRLTEEGFDYFIGVRYEGAAPADMQEMTVGPSLWAVFPDILDAWKRLFTQWLPGSGYDLADLPIIECHYPPEHAPATELWVPVVPRAEGTGQ